MPSWTNEQKEAIEKSGQNIIVSAGAGSGKTAVLTERVIYNIKKGINVNEFLILTFTNAAAKEMKDRIRKALKEDNTLKKQLDLIDGAFITTFDSFALSVVKKYHYLLNVSPNVSIADNSLIKMKKEEIINQIFDSLYKEKNLLFLKLIGDLCVKNDETIKDYILNVDEKLNLKIDKVKFLKEYSSKYLNEEFATQNTERYFNLIKDKIKELELTLDDIRLFCDGEYFEKLSAPLYSLINSQTYDEIKASFVQKLVNLPKNSDENLKSLKEELGEIYKEIKKLCKYDSLNEIKDNIVLTFDYVTIINEIIMKLEKQISSYKHENNIYEFNDIIKMSINVIEMHNDVKEEIKNTFKEIMIDEYQDTSDLQEYFIGLISNNNVYMVGDIKQSIYRFRNANPNIFKQKYELYSKTNGGIKIDLNKNFRSRSEVVSNINNFFDYVMDSYIGGADYKLSHQMIFGQTDYEKDNKPNQNYNAEILIYEFNKDSKYSKEEIEFFKVAQDINEKIAMGYLIYDKDIKNYRKCEYHDFAILIDRGKTFDKAKKIFEYMHIPLSILRDESITLSYVVALIHNILKLIIKYINNEFDDEYKHLFMSIMRSFLFSYNDEEIFETLKNNNLKSHIITDKIKKLIIDIENKTTIEILNNIYKEFNFYENIIKIGNVEENLIILEHMNNLASNEQNIGYTFYEFTDYLEKIISSEYELKIENSKSNNNSAKIMTIHKSKGLEYPICYFVGLYKKFNFSDIKDRIIYSDNYGIIAPYYKNGIGKTICVDLLKNDYIIDEISERIRLFYVALTRAKEKMIFILPNDVKKLNTEYKISNRIKLKSFADIIYAISTYLSNYITFLDIETIPLTKKYNNLKIDNILIDKGNDKIEFKEYKDEDTVIEENKFSKVINEIIDETTKKNLELGLLFHEALEYIDFKNPNYDDIENEFIKNKVKKFISKLTNIKNAKIYKESEFIYNDENTNYHGIIDLVIEYEDHIDLIDYKLKYTETDAYKKQLSGYKIYLGKISNKKINVYLYSILNEEFLKIDI